MDARRLVALGLVLTLAGGAMAAGNTFMSHEGEDVSVIQQHTVFVELVLEDSDKVDEVHEFGALVGLVKECKQEEESFDNAVLWFNDQFLFGDKRSDSTRNVSDDDALGHQPPRRTYDHQNGSINETQQDWDWEGDEDQVGFIGANQFSERWGGCFIPSGFMHAIGHQDPYGTGGQAVQEDTGTNETAGGPETLRQLIDLDDQCRGCIFEYEATFYITDPNGHEWMVDKLVYPGSFNGDLFGSGGGEDCYDGSGLTGFEDPRSTGVHAEECEDDDSGHSNHRSGGNHTGQPQGPLTEPMYTVHLQVDPSTGTGFADEQPWIYEDEDKSTAPRKGMPYPLDETDAVHDLCKNELRDQARPCAIEYNFLVAVDFAAFDGAASSNYQGSSVTHDANNDDSAAQGDSHPHNPHAEDRGPSHDHSTVNLDLFYYEKAPHFVEDNPYWDENGAPPSVNEDCSATADGENYSDAQEKAVQNRAVLVCNTSSNSGSFHMHDGSQSP